MSDWSLQQLLSGLHDDIQQKLATVRLALVVPGTKGNASEAVWLELLQTYLPKRYSAATAHVVDSTGAFSDQIDVVVFDRQYSPFIFSFQGATIIPAESVYAVFEAKQSSQCHSGRLRPRQGCKRQAVAQDELAHPSCRWGLSSQTAPAHPWRSPDL